MCKIIKNRIPVLKGIGGTLFGFLMLLISCASIDNFQGPLGEPRIDQTASINGDQKEKAEEKESGSEAHVGLENGKTSTEESQDIDDEFNGHKDEIGQTITEARTQEDLINDILDKFNQLETSLGNHRQETEKNGLPGEDKWEIKESGYLKTLDGKIQGLLLNTNELLKRLSGLEKLEDAQIKLIEDLPEKLVLLIEERNRESGEIGSKEKEGNKNDDADSKFYIEIKSQPNIQLNEINEKIKSLINLKQKTNEILLKKSVFDVGKLGFLALIVALSSYIASVRFNIIKGIGKKGIPGKIKRRRKLVLLFLIPADFCLVFGGILLSFDLLSEFILGEKAGFNFFSISCFLFFVAVITLAGHHLVAWFSIHIRKIIKFLYRVERRKLFILMVSAREFCGNIYNAISRIFK